MFLHYLHSIQGTGSSPGQSFFLLPESPRKERNTGEIPQGTKCDRISQPWQPWRKMTTDDDRISYIMLDSAQSVSDVSANVRHVRFNLRFKHGQTLTIQWSLALPWITIHNWKVRDAVTCTAWYINDHALCTLHGVNNSATTHLCFVEMSWSLWSPAVDHVRVGSVDVYSMFNLVNRYSML